MSEAKQILENIISDFSSEKFGRFFREKSRQFAESGENLSHLNDDDFTNGKKIGEIKFSNGDQLIVCAFAVQKELSERAGKKKQYDKAKDILKNNRNFSAGIFVFYDSAGNFRFSLIYPESIGARRQWNNFRRFTYFVSGDPAVTNKTFLARIGGGDFSDLDKIKEVFSVEKVTKEFFGQYKDLFGELVSELNINHTFKNEAVKYNIDTENFAKKLLGQIVFLYFLQKKRWLGAPKNKSLKYGDENFLQNLFNGKYIKYNNFFNDILEHLFYGALNKKSDKVGTFYRSYLNCQIPFLNGGLFESEYEWEKTKIYLDNKIFERILEVFNRYNFTVDENSPIDQEIAIDPEMLGKVFENLLSENLRKGKGTYYTPREIVHYMCQESLINYLAAKSRINEDLIRRLITQQDILSDKELENLSSAPEQLEQAAEKNIFFEKPQARMLDKLLQEIKVVDPACGSGAFLVGMLHEITRARFYLDQWYINKNILGYDLKKETIQNCIYGVDIDPGAIEIAKLRLWLSLVVEYELEEIEPLPNLDYKIMQGNSLLEELVLGDASIKLDNFSINKDARLKNLFEKEQKDLFEDSDEQKKIIENLIKLHKEYFKISDSEEKRRKKKEIDKIEQDLIENSVKKEIKKIEADNKNIGNYIAPGIGMTKKDAIKMQKNLSKQGQIMSVLDEFKKTGVKPFFLWRLYFADVFENGGFDVVIANPPYEEISNKEDKNIFQKFYFNILSGHYDLYIFFFGQAFNIAKRGAIVSFITPHTYLHYSQFENLRKLIYNNGHIIEITNRISNIFDSAVVDNAIILLKTEKGNKNDISKFLYKQIKNGSLENQDIVKLKNSEFNFESFDIEAIKNMKILKHFSENTELLGTITENSQGITVYAKVQGKKINWFRNKIQDKNSKPIIRGRDIQKYFLLWNNQYIQYGKWLWCSRNPKFFKQEKIFLRQTADCLIGTYVKEPTYCIDSAHSIINSPDHKDYNLKYILAILNSTFGDYLYHLLISETGKVFAQVKLTFLRKLPIKKIPTEQQKPFINLVDQILKKKKDNPKADTRELEKKIDEMVYDLYGLSKEEREIVENSGK